MKAHTSLTKPLYSLLFASFVTQILLKSNSTHTAPQPSLSVLDFYSLLFATRIAQKKTDNLKKKMFTFRDETGTVGDRSATISIAVHSDDDVFHISSPQDIMVMIPGNPGVSAFYTDFLCHLKKKQPEHRVVCLGFAGHSTGQRDGAFSVAEQIGFVGSLIDKIRARNEEAKLHIIGHSVGSYVGVNVAAILPDNVVASYTGLFPTVEHIVQGSNAVIRPIFLPGVRHALSGLAGLLGYLPRWLLKGVSSLFAQEAKGGGTLDIVASLAEYSVVHNILYMSQTEMVDIKDIPHEVLGKVAGKATFYYAGVDGWVPDHLIPKMEEHLETLTQRKVGSTPACSAPRVIRDATEAPHAFVLSHSEEVAECLSPIFN